MSKNFLEFGYITDEKFPDCIIAFVDLCLVYSLIFLSDCRSYVALDLLDHVDFLVKEAGRRIELFRGKTPMLERLIKNEIISWLIQMV